MRRFLSGMALALAGVPAFASFELVLVADNGSGSFGTRRIHRFDGDTGTYMGSFGGFGANIIGTHLSQATNTLFVMTSDGRTAEYDYNTGALRRGYANGMFSASTFVTARPSGDVALSLGGVNPWTQSFPRVTSWISNLGSLSGASDLNAGGWLDDRNVFVYDAVQGRAVQYGVSENGQSGSVVGFAFVGAGYTASQMTRVSFGITDFMIHPVANQINYYVPGTWGFVNTTSTQNRHSARGHDGFFTMGLRGSLWSLDKYDGSFGQRGQWGAGIVQNPASMQAVVAPEPGTLLALGVGGLALLRRRRNRK